MSNIGLSSSMRSNLLSLQQTQSLQDETSTRLSTGLKVNSAIDNPSSYYTASSLNNRANDLSALMDSMGQSISTLQATTEAIDSLTAFLEQASVIATQALEMSISSSTPEDPSDPSDPSVPGGGSIGPTQSTEEWVADGYTAVSTELELKNAISEGAKIVLSTNITLTDSIDISADNVVIEGNGCSLSMSSTTADTNMINISGANATINNITLDYANTSVNGNDATTNAAICVDGASASADISYISINASGDGTYGVRALNDASVTIDNTLGISTTGTGATALLNGNAWMFNGAANTEAILAAGDATTYPAAYAAASYSVDGTEYNDWYLPSQGELMQIYGYNADKVTSWTYTSGVDASLGIDIINASLKALGDAGADSTELIKGWYWSSSEYISSYSWNLGMSDGFRDGYGKISSLGVRGAQLIENCFDPLSLSADSSGDGSGSAAPEIGDVMYSDGSYGSADDYDGSKTAIGVVFATTEDGTGAYIVALENASDSTLQWTPSGSWSDVATLPNLNNSSEFVSEIKSEGVFNVTNTNLGSGASAVATMSLDADDAATTEADYSKYSSQYQQVLSQFDSMVSDASYKGINLLNGDDLTVYFNEDRTSNLLIKGVDATTSGLGLNTLNWNSLADVTASIEELQNATNSLRNIASDFGNSYNIVASRKEFTESLVNILTAGSDKLVLADMNEESANMLTLQTRQSLATNSLSLASQSSQSVLQLFV